MTAYDNDNIFAKILRGEIPCFKLYEDEHTFVFMDIMPRTDGHCLVIPKAPARNMLDIEPDDLYAVMDTVKEDDPRRHGGNGRGRAYVSGQRGRGRTGGVPPACPRDPQARRRADAPARLYPGGHGRAGRNANKIRAVLER